MGLGLAVNSRAGLLRQNQIHGRLGRDPSGECFRAAVSTWRDQRRHQRSTFHPRSTARADQMTRRCPCHCQQRRHPRRWPPPRSPGIQSRAIYSGRCTRHGPPGTPFTSFRRTSPIAPLFRPSSVTPLAYKTVTKRMPRSVSWIHVQRHPSNSIT